MIESADAIETGTVLKADLCIVGAGAAGITLALAMRDSGLDVLLLEGGREQLDPRAQALMEGEVADPALHSPPVFYRQRRLGGATAIWGGRCVPLDPLDFEPREAVPGSGWPIGYEEVARHYPAASRLCEAGQGSYSADGALPTGTPPMFAAALGNGVTAEGLERFSCPTNFGTRYRARLAHARRVRLITGVNCTAVRLQAGGRQVKHLDLATLDGRRLQVQAQAVVLAVGGLETPRLLLASNDVHQAGLGNAHDVVGRYYMCHLAGSVGMLKLAGATAAVRHGYERSDDGIYIRRRLALTAESQRRLGVANMVARLHFPAVSDPGHGSSVLSGIFLSRRLLSHEYGRRVANAKDGGLKPALRHIGNVLRYPHDAAGFLTHWLLKHHVAPRRFPSVILKNRANRFSLEINAEQRPLAESRVTLVQATDALGMPQLKVDWRYHRADIDSVGQSLQQIARSVAQAGLGEYTFDEARLEHDLTCFGAYGGHHIGTARMGTDARSSVVDADCRVHGVDNLWIASSAVFPTSGQANPTLSIVALSLRLAEHLGPRLCGRPLDAAAAVA
ncbi:GMC oxidoreductase [Roseateles sp. LYH14W]|uniref:GMC oxidoreductase n=1 Tax=Pelomonas parva TaxID=3299032 RepID=A0ABW7F679_9BURK